MKERIIIVWRKIQNELKPSGFKEGDNITFYRLIKFIFSMKGIIRLWKIIYKFFRLFYRILGGKGGLGPVYSTWLKKYERAKISPDELLNEVNKWDKKPLISVIMPVYNPNIEYLRRAILSVCEQVYDNWELCISDDCSDNGIVDYLNELQSNDKVRVVFNDKNVNISLNMNNAVAISSGEYISFLDQDDLLANDALYFVAKAIIEKHPDVIYSDEDKINDKGERSEPFFKPQWSPHSLLSRNYINHLTTIKKELFVKVGGFREGYEGAQDHDLLLRITAITDKIEHIPEILYHWRIHSNSTALNPDSKLWAFEAGKKVVSDYINSLGYEVNVQSLENVPGNYKLKIKVQGSPKVSIIIPTKDKVSILKNCVDSIYRKTLYDNFEIIIINNNSVEDKTYSFFEEYSKKYPDSFRVEEFSEEFNYSKIQNFGAEKSTGEYLLLLNNDTEVKSDSWIEDMLSFAQIPNVGAVGAKLFFSNNRLQHVGVVLGIYGIVGHIYVGSDGKNAGYFQNNNLITNYSAVTAACLMINKNKFITVNGFDTELAIEYNDVDFCLRLLSAGLYNVYSPDVKLIHYESLTRGHPSQTNASNRRSMKEGKYFKDKWGELLKNDPFYNPNLTLNGTEFQYNV